MVFRSCLSGDTDKFISEGGSPTLQEYEYSFDADGKKQLVKKDSVINVYDRIQADRDATDINLLMQRFALGDSEAINVRKGMYIDATKMPTTYAEVFQRGLEAEQYFEGLPTDLKEMFDNSYSVFFTEMGSKEFDSKMEKYNDRFVNHQFEVKDDTVIKEDSTVKEIEYHE